MLLKIGKVLLVLAAFLAFSEYPQDAPLREYFAFVGGVISIFVAGLLLVGLGQKKKSFTKKIPIDFVHIV